MHVFLDTDDQSFAEKVRDKYSQNFPATIQDYIPMQFPRLDPYTEVVKIHYGTHIFNNPSVGESRYTQLAFATEGSVLFSDTPRNESNSPIHVGNLNACITDNAVVHLRNSVKRSTIFKDLPVRYFGITKEDPKNVLVIDNKKWDKCLPLVLEVLEKTTDNWWYNSAFISTGNAENLTNIFEDDLYYSTPVALTDSAKKKLELAGIDYIDASHLPGDPKLGVKLRELTRRENDM